jgi:hypothetical protein
MVVRGDLLKALWNCLFSGRGSAETLERTLASQSQPIGAARSTKLLGPRNSAARLFEEAREKIWSRLVAEDRAQKAREYKRPLDKPGAMPDAYYTRQHREGEFNRRGDAVYLDRSSSARRYLVNGDYNASEGIVRLGSLGLWRTHTSRTAMVAAVLGNGRSIYIIREYGSALIRLTLQKDGSYREPRTDNYFFPGITGGNYLELKRWWTMAQLARPRFPPDLTAIGREIDRLEAKRLSELPSNRKKRATEKTQRDAERARKKLGLGGQRPDA